MNQGLTQAFDTIGGDAYSVTFGIGAATRDGSVTSIVLPYINSVLVPGGFQYTNPGPTVLWQDFSFSFNATGSSTTIGFFNGDPTGSLNGLDNVRISDLGPVAATPVPGALPLLATGLAGLGWLARRRRKQAA